MSDKSGKRGAREKGKNRKEKEVDLGQEEERIERREGRTSMK
jgi:hypothetical protein